MKTTDVQGTTTKKQLAVDSFMRSCNGGNGIHHDIELEDKTTLAFFSPEGQEITPRQFSEEKGITYPGQLMEQKLMDRGIGHFGIVNGIALKSPYTKKLISVCYDDIDGSLSDQGITLRKRYEQNGSGYPSGKQMQTPDVSSKFPIGEGTARRFEFEAKTDFVIGEDDRPAFNLSMIPMIEYHMTKRAYYSDMGPLVALEWLEALESTVGLSFKDKREVFNINCKRSSPFAILHSACNRNGDLIRDSHGDVVVFEADALTPAQKLQGAMGIQNKIAFMLCLDVNRFFAPGQKNKICTDIEWEHEHQSEACDYTPGAICSDENITPEEVSAGDVYLQRLKQEVMEKHNIQRSPLSGMSKSDRAHYYMVQHTKNNTGFRSQFNQVTVHGSTKNHVLTHVENIDHLCSLSPVVSDIVHAGRAERQRRLVA